jgi:magnesium-protoporphyrin O-methyltransferase
MPCSCCTGESLDIFGERTARRDLRRYLRKGLGGSDARLIAAWAEETGLRGATVLEIGGGIGQIQAELLRRGAAARGAVVEVVPAYEAPAAELARAVAVADRSSFVLADLLAEPQAVDPADLVVLRRVVCCSPNGPALLGVAAEKARHGVLASYPRDRALIRAVAWLQNAAFAVVRKRFRVYVHAPAKLHHAVARHGLRPSRVSRGLVWETTQFERVLTNP